MNRNNYMYTLYKTMTQADKQDNTDAIEQCARCWMQLNPENPFTYDTPEYEEFFQIRKCYMIWARGDVDQKINRRRMIQHAKALCEINPKQPYVFDKKADEEEKQAEEQKKKMDLLARQELEKAKEEKKTIEKPEANLEDIQPKKVINEKQETILGVIPGKKSLLKLFHMHKKEGE